MLVLSLMAGLRKSDPPTPYCFESLRYLYMDANMSTQATASIAGKMLQCRRSNSKYDVWFDFINVKLLGKGLGGLVRFSCVRGSQKYYSDNFTLRL